MLGHPFLQGRPQSTQITTINMYLLEKHNVHIQYHGNHIEVKKFKDMLEIDMLRNSSQNPLGVLKDDF